LALEGKTDYQYGNCPDLRPSQSVIDAVKLALEDENACIRVIRVGIAKKIWLIFI
jgi:hypothetical protein